MIHPLVTPIAGNHFASIDKSKSSRFSREARFVLGVLYETPAEAAAFAVGAIAMRFFIPSISAALFGITASLILARLAIKVIDRYNERALMDLKLEVCRLNKAYPKLQTIGLLFAIAVSFVIPSLGFFLGVAVGAYGAIVLDIENYKLLQRANRK